MFNFRFGQQRYALNDKTLKEKLQLNNELLIFFWVWAY